MKPSTVAIKDLLVICSFRQVTATERMLCWASVAYLGVKVVECLWLQEPHRKQAANAMAIGQHIIVYDYIYIIVMIVTIIIIV